jgi:hypothetical protein
MSERNYPSNFQLDIPLERYPLTRAFMIEAAVRIKGEDEAFWDEALKGYKIYHPCSCGECLSFYLTPPDGEGPFDRGAITHEFNGTLVIFRENDHGQLLDFELPDITEVPFLDEYYLFGRADVISTITPEQAKKKVKYWFEQNCKSTMFTIVID